MFWRAFLSDLKKRGLTGVRLVISNQHAGLVAALNRSFQKAAISGAGCTSRATSSRWCPQTHADMVAAVFRTIFAQPDARSGW